MNYIFNDNIQLQDTQGITMKQQKEYISLELTSAWLTLCFIESYRFPGLHGSTCFIDFSQGRSMIRVNYFVMFGELNRVCMHYMKYGGAP